VLEGVLLSIIDLCYQSNDHSEVNFSSSFGMCGI